MVVHKISGKLSACTNSGYQALLSQVGRAWEGGYSLTSLLPLAMEESNWWMAAPEMSMCVSVHAVAMFVCQYMCACCVCVVCVCVWCVCVCVCVCVHVCVCVCVCACVYHSGVEGMWKMYRHCVMHNWTGIVWNWGNMSWGNIIGRRLEESSAKWLTTE